MPRLHLAVRSMKYFVADFLGPAISSRDTHQDLAFDHNYDFGVAPWTKLEDTVFSNMQWVAWHGYMGTPAMTHGP